MKILSVSTFAGIALCVMCGTSYGSSWTISLGGTGEDSANAIRQTTDGGYIIAGYTSSFGAGDSDVWVLKLDADGSIVWQKTYGGPGEDYANAILQTTDGGYIIAGYTSSFGAGDSDVWVLKLDADGSIVWQKTYGGPGDDYASVIQQTADGSYIVAGSTASFGAGWDDAWVLKLDADGSIFWQKTYGSSACEEHANAIQPTADGGYVIAGSSGPCPFVSTDSDAWVLKLDADGTISWQKAYGGSNAEYIAAIQQTADGGYIAAGSTASFKADAYDAWILKLDVDGSIVWQKTYGGSLRDSAVAIQQTTDKGYIAVGIKGQYAYGAAGSPWVLKLDADGSISWQKTYGGIDHEYVLYAIQQTVDGGYVAAGGKLSPSPNYYDAWVLKLDQLGGMGDCGFIASSSVSPQYSTSAVVESDLTLSAATGSVASSASSAGTSAVAPASVCSAATTLYRLDLGTEGRGTGRVTSIPSGMDCVTDCSWYFGSTGTVALTATPDPLATFVGWSGDCSADGRVAMDADKSCIATFETPADFTAAPLYGYVSFVVRFTDSSTHSPTFWSWDFGDSETAFGSNPAHIYQKPGLYTVTLTAAGPEGVAKARKVDYVTIVTCDNRPVRIPGPAYRNTISLAYADLGGNGDIDLQAVEFDEDVILTDGKTVTLTGGYPCDYGTRSGDSVIKGSLTIGSGGGPVTVSGITLQ